jgi:hypothetical protein
MNFEVILYMLGIGMTILELKGGNFDGGNGAFYLDFVDIEVNAEANHEKTKVEIYKKAQTSLYEGYHSS